MELNFKPGKFALNRNTLETVVVKEVKDDKILTIDMKGVVEKWGDTKDYNLFRRKNDKWVIEGPPIIRTQQEMDILTKTQDRSNISERFK